MVISVYSPNFVSKHANTAKRTCESCGEGGGGQKERDAVQWRGLVRISIHQLTGTFGLSPSPFLLYVCRFGGHLLTFLRQLWVEGSQMLHQLSHIGVDDITAILAREVAPRVETQVFAHVGFVEELLPADMTSSGQFTWICMTQRKVSHSVTT